ncbi:MAG: hypothetical protein JWN64_191 [Parcubacteria group bacterium]|nr:hypothetical protein [Parcubacteria group bacterium]
MEFFSFKRFKKNSESVALFDIGATTVGGAFAHMVEGKSPVIYYATRVAVLPHEGEAPLPAMIRALHEVCALLVAEGAPTLRREVGDAHIHRIEASIGAPWQESEIEVKSMQRDKPFMFSHEFMATASAPSKPLPEGRTLSGRDVVATVLNGYETTSPFGKKVKRADLVILSSTLETEAQYEVERTLRHSFHTHSVSITAFAPVAYAVFRDVFAHQKDYIVLDISGMSTDAAFIKRGLLMGVSSIPTGLTDLLSSLDGEKTASSLGSGLIDRERNTKLAARIAKSKAKWIEELRDVLGEFSSRQPLPRTVFIIADPFARDFLKKLLDSSTLRSLWLSDEPLGVIPVAPQHFAPFVQTRGTAEGDLYLSMLALFHTKRPKGELS